MGARAGLRLRSGWPVAVAGTAAVGTLLLLNQAPAQQRRPQRQRRPGVAARPPPATTTSPPCCRWSDSSGTALLPESGLSSNAGTTLLPRTGPGRTAAKKGTAPLRAGTDRG